MFAKITVQQQRTGDADNPLDLGFLAEAMLFYGKTEVITTRASIGQLIRGFGIDILIEFLERDHLRLKFEPNLAGIVTSNGGTPLEEHFPTIVEVQKRQLLDVIQPVIFDSIGRFGRSRRLSRRLADRIVISPIDEPLLKRYTSDVASSDYVQNAFRRILATYIPDISLPENLRFQVFLESGGKMKIETNADFSSLNDLYHRHIPVSHSSLDSAYILSHLLLARKMLEDGARNDSEIAVAPVYESLISLNLTSAFQARNRSATQITAFQDFIFDDGRAIGNAIATRARSFRDLLPVLDKATKFRSWLKTKQPDANLLKEYHRAVTEQTWVDKLPTRAVRWSLFTGAGLIIDTLGGGGLGTLSGVAVSAGDAFLLDKLVKGWKPNQFVEKGLQDFVG
jgi:hypothetical protein